MFVSDNKIEAINEKLKSIDDLGKFGYKIQSDEPVVKIRLAEILKERGITPADLSKMSAISRQNINAVIKGSMKPGIDFALKIAYVLDVAVEAIFSLTDSAWVQTVKNSEESTLYIDVVDVKILDGRTRRERVAQDGYEYYDTENKVLMTEEDYQNKLKEYVFDNIELAEQDVVEEFENEKKKASDKVITSTARKRLVSSFEKVHVKRYVKLARDAKPLVNPAKKK